MKNKIAKVVSWRIISMLITMIVMWIATGDVREATGLTLGLHIILTVVNFGFEVVWGDIYDEGE